MIPLSSAVSIILYASESNGTDILLTPANMENENNNKSKNTMFFFILFPF